MNILSSLLLAVSLYLISTYDFFNTPRTDPADYYNQNSAMRSDLGQKLIASLKLQGDERVLDLGCRTGKTTKLCADQLSDGFAFGVDVSADYINFAQNEYQDVANVVFSVADMANLQFDQEFDVVYSLFCLHWIPAQRAAMRGIANSLTKGGRALLYIALEDKTIDVWEQSFQIVMAQHPEWQQYSAATTFFQPVDVWAAWCKDAGFTIVNHRTQEQRTIFNTVQDYKNFLFALPIVPNMSPCQKSEFLDLMLAQIYAAYGRSQDEPFEHILTYVVLDLAK